MMPGSEAGQTHKKLLVQKSSLFLYTKRKVVIFMLEMKMHFLDLEYVQELIFKKIVEII